MVGLALRAGLGSRECHANRRTSTRWRSQLPDENVYRNCLEVAWVKSLHLEHDWYQQIPKDFDERLWWRRFSEEAWHSVGTFTSSPARRASPTAEKPKLKTTVIL